MKITVITKKNNFSFVHLGVTLAISSGSKGYHLIVCRSLASLATDSLTGRIWGQSKSWWLLIITSWGSSMILIVVCSAMIDMILTKRWRCFIKIMVKNQENICLLDVEIGENDDGGGDNDDYEEHTL